ncbi:MAG: hypothetical protein ACXABK_03310 [Candidatus Heimdallarchaeaceae archaeon]|jgi:hypothetical protein
MSWLKSILSRRKKTEVDVPQLFNGLFQFQHPNIIDNSKSTEHPLSGNEFSNTLYLEGEMSRSSIGFIFAGEYGCNIFSSIKERVEKDLPSSLILSNQEQFQSLNERVPFLELPSDYSELLSFSKGIKWYDENEINIDNSLERSLRDISLVFIIVENASFLFGIISKILFKLKDKNIQPVIILHIPVDDKLKTTDIIQTEEMNSEVALLTFIHFLLKKNTEDNFPFLLLDYSQLKRGNLAQMELSALRNLLRVREANILIDFIIATQNPSQFYQIDLSNLVRIFENVRGPCKLISFDIYDNKPSLSKLFEKQPFSESFIHESDPSRGFVVIQPGPNGLLTNEYKNIRKNYENKDVILSIMNNRENGAIIRGIFSFLELPELILDRYDSLSDYAIELTVEEGTTYLETSNFDDLWTCNEFKITRISKEDKKD